MSLVLRDSPRVTGILRKCYSHVEVSDRDRNRGVGVTNLKRLFGRPDDLRVVVEALGATVGRADALASADTGGAPLAAVVAYQLGLPAVFVREVPRSTSSRTAEIRPPTTRGSRASGCGRAARST